MKTLERVDHYLKEGKLPERYHRHAYIFLSSWREQNAPEEDNIELLDGYLENIVEQVHNPYKFPSFHVRVTEPYNYYQFGLDFIRPLIEWDKSTLNGAEHLARMVEQIESGENVILFGNHQTEPDPAILSLFLEEKYPRLAEEMIFVAGSRVTMDPVAIPFSLGRNLLCIHSKRHINHPPEQRAEKQRHNQRTMKRMAELLQEGGQCIYVAPSGGRDRPDANGNIALAPFDAAAIAMFLLMAKQATTPTHFYPLALSSYALMPPPNTIDKELGEERRVARTPLHIGFGQEIDIQGHPGHNLPNKKERREALAKHIYNEMADLYSRFPCGAAL